MSLYFVWVRKVIPIQKKWDLDHNFVIFGKIILSASLCVTYQKDNLGMTHNGVKDMYKSLKGFAS